MPTRIINLSAEIIDDIEVPIVAGSDKVMYLLDGYYMAFAGIAQGTYCKHRVHYATIFRDKADKWLVSAESESILDTIGSGQPLDSLVDNDPSDWQCYRCAVGDNGLLVFDDIDTPGLKGILTALGHDAPLPWQIYDIFGMQATVRSGCGPNMRPTEIEATTTWYGDQISTLVTARL